MFFPAVKKLPKKNKSTAAHAKSTKILKVNQKNWKMTFKNT